MASRRRVLYARWEIRAFRSIERFADYKQIKFRMQPIINGAAEIQARQGGKWGWRSMLSNTALATITAVGAVLLVLLATATLVVMLT